MSEMIERVARAIFEAWRTAKGAEGTWDEALRDHATGQAIYPTAFEYVELARAEARAAIEAMQEPTPFMCQFAENNFDRDADNIAVAHRAFMTAALASPPTPEDAGER